MNQKIVCQKGTCTEKTETVETEFDSMFDDSNIVEQIEHDLWGTLIA